MLCPRAAVAALGIPDRSNLVANTAATLLSPAVARDSGSRDAKAEEAVDIIIRTGVRTN